MYYIAISIFIFFAFVTGLFFKQLHKLFLRKPAVPKSCKHDSIRQFLACMDWNCGEFHFTFVETAKLRVRAFLALHIYANF